MTHDLFVRANHLWFHEGRTREALAAYEEARRRRPTDPVVAFQLARVLWSLDRFAEAQALFDEAADHGPELSAAARRHLERWRELARWPPAGRRFPELPLEMLDRDRLERDEPDVGWRTVAEAAHARGMPGLAAYALDRWGGVPFDAEDARDIGRLESAGDRDEAVLASMMGSGGGERGPRFQPPSHRTRPAGTRDRLDPPTRPPAEVAPSAVAPDAPPERAWPELGALPLHLRAEARPGRAPLGVPTTLVASLSNPTNTPLIVNRRLLLNHVGEPGEVWLDVKGPAGYRNLAGFHIRVGTTPAELFVSLGPGEAVTQSWMLEEYASLHVPGRYDVTLVYHNERDRTPDGRPMPVGQVRATAPVERHA